MNTSFHHRHKRINSTALLSFGLFLFAGAARASMLQAVPEKFDFGWCPDDAKVSCTFVLKNTGGDMIPLQSLQPSCGCTAATFSPENLASHDETKIGLTFNTRGYAMSPFHKTAVLKTGSGKEELTVAMLGFVKNPKANVLPTGTGVASFEPKSKSSQTITLQNKTDKDLTLSLVQEPANWAHVNAEGPLLKAKGTAEINIKIDGALDENRNTSCTFEAVGDTEPYRVTIAIQSGPPAPTYQHIQAPAPQKSSDPAKPTVKPSVKPSAGKTAVKSSTKKAKTKNSKPHNTLSNTNQ